MKRTVAECTIVRPGGAREGRQGLEYGEGISAQPTKPSPGTAIPPASPHPGEPANGSKRKRDGPARRAPARTGSGRRRGAR
jgi:hypothetical protein